MEAVYFRDMDIKLDDEEKTFLKERFGVIGLDALSDDKYQEIFDILADIEVDEVSKVPEDKYPEELSNLGILATNLVTYILKVG